MKAKKPPGWYSSAQRKARREAREHRRRVRVLEKALSEARAARIAEMTANLAASADSAVARITTRSTAKVPATKGKKKGKAAPVIGRDGRAQEIRDAGHRDLPKDRRPKVDINADPLLWLDQRNILRDPLSIGLSAAQLEATRGAAMYRLEAGKKAAELFRRAQVSPVKAASWGMHVDQSGGPRSLTAGAYQALEEVGALRKMPALLFDLLHGIAAGDLWPWNHAGASRGVVYGEIRLALDMAAVHFGLMRRRDFSVRWPGVALPWPPRPPRSAPPPDGLPAREAAGPASPPSTRAIPSPSRSR